MFSKTSTTESTAAFSDDVRRLKDALDSAEAVLIGAGAGLSTSAGHTYGGARFRKYFADFERKYGFHDMYSGGFTRFESPEEKWAYWSRHIAVNRYMDPPRPVYRHLLELVREKDYFVITTNVDHCFQKAGFDRDRLFYTQGDYGLFQCSVPCCQETFDNESLIRQMIARQKNMKIPPDLLPVCPRCGKPLTLNLRSDETFVEDEGWHRAVERYEDFLRTRLGRRILLLELGVGYNTPVIIKFPFWRMTAKNPQAVYACVNRKEAACPEEIAGQSICIGQDIGQVLAELLRLAQAEKQERT